MAAQRARGETTNAVKQRLLPAHSFDTVRLREIGTLPIGTILEFASVPPRKIETHLLGFCRPRKRVL